MAARRVWIVDGHNVIFAVGGLERLQATRRGDEARRLLAERLEVFAHQRGEPVLLVFDGHDLPSHPQASRSALFEVAYARRGDQAADRRILDEARRRAAEGGVVTVVTNDVRTLASALPRAVRHLRVRDFWLRHIEPPAGKDEKRIEGDFSDIEKEMLSLPSEESRRATRGSHRPLATDTPGETPGAGRTPTAAALREDETRRKRERGRLRHARMLKRRTKPA
jgi:predicted RNA-binding protein with PIN domain